MLRIADRKMLLLEKELLPLQKRQHLLTDEWQLKTYTRSIAMKL